MYFISTLQAGIERTRKQEVMNQRKNNGTVNFIITLEMDLNRSPQLSVYILKHLESPL